MIRPLFLLLSVFASPLLYAQNYSVSPEVVKIAVDLDTVEHALEVRAPAIITNHTESTLRIKWERIVNDKPDCWETAVFGVWIQAIPATDSLDFQLAPQDAGYLDVFAFITNNTAMPHDGVADVVLRLTNLDEPTDTLLVSYHFSVTGGASCLSSTVTLEEEPARLYPNPTADYFQLDAPVVAHQMTILDLMGRPWRSMAVQPERQYDIRDLPAGIYLIQLKDRFGQALQTVRITKR